MVPACLHCQPIAEVSSIIALSLWLVNNTYAQLIIKTDGDCAANWLVNNIT
jgi:hypothetical protein